jgi:predicted nuclease of predicted toxin-antitoxin system
MGMVKFYSNENFPLDIVQELRQLGYDVLTSYDAGQANQGIPDDEVLAFAIQRERAVITLNRDDFIELHRSGIPHHGIIICKTDRDYSGQAQALHSYLQDELNNNPVGTFCDRLIRVKKQNQPKSSRQVFVIQEYTR